MPSTRNQPDAVPLARTEQIANRADELANLMDAAVPHLARQILAALPRDRRTESESVFLWDCSRNRRQASRETLARLMDLSGRAELVVVAEMFRAIEVRQAVRRSECLHEAGMALEEADVALDRARSDYAKEPTPTRATVAWECATQLVRKALQYADLAASKMHFPLRRTV